MLPADLAWAVIGLVLTVLVLSYLAGDNILFRIVIYAFIGISAAYLVLVVLTQIVWPHMVLAIVQGSLEARLTGIAGSLLSLLLAAKLVPRLERLGNVSMAYLVGVGAAVAIVGAVSGTLVPQFMVSLDITWLGAQPTAEHPAWLIVVNGALLLVGMITTMVVFHYGAHRNKKDEIRRGWIVEGLSWIGKLVIAITFGAVFAGIFSSALTALVERIATLITVIRLLVR